MKGEHVKIDCTGSYFSQIVHLQSCFVHGFCNSAKRHSLFESYSRTAEASELVLTVPALALMPGLEKGDHPMMETVFAACLPKMEEGSNHVHTYCSPTPLQP
eukprot:5381457-Amphidinium_carterae.1